MNDIIKKYNCIHFSVGNTDFEVFFADEIFAQNSWQARDHEHLFCECHYLKSGFVSVTVIDKQFNLGENNFCVFPINVRHKIETVAAPNRRLCFYVVATLNKKSNYNTFDTFNSIFSAKNATFINNDSPYLNKVIEISEAKEEYAWADEEKIRNLLALYMIDLFELFNIGDSAKDIKFELDLKNEVRLKIDTFIEEVMSYTTKSKDLAKYLCLSERQANRTLKEICGKNFIEIKTDKLIEQAKNMIEETSLSLKEISAALGYNSYNGFYKAFKLHTGITPDEYLNNTRSK